jgi:integrase/recombinase XerD
MSVGSNASEVIMSLALTITNQIFTSEAEVFLNLYKPRLVSGTPIGNKNTFNVYKRALTRFYVWFIASGMTDIKLIKLPELSLFQDALLAEYKPKTVQVYCSVIKEFFNFLFNRAKIANNEFANLKIVAVDKRDSSAVTLTETELKKVMKHIRSLDNSPTNIVNKIILLVLANSGLRESELCKLKLGDLVLQGDNLVLSVSGKGFRKRFVVLSPKVSGEIIKLQSLIENALMVKLTKSDYLVQAVSNNRESKNVKPMDRSNIIRRINLISNECKIAFTPHSLRRTLATNLHLHGVPIEAIQRILGHENITTTQSYISMNIDKETGIQHAVNY